MFCPTTKERSTTLFQFRIACYRLLTLTVLLFAVIPPCWAQTKEPNADHNLVSPEAADALRKGTLAAKQEDYLLAIRYFQAARKAQDWSTRSKTEPDAPIIYYDLGLAESKIPGRELRAICWFEAYLAAYPAAPNREAVRAQVEVLDVKSQSNLSHLIQTAQDVAIKIPDRQDAYPGLEAVRRDDALAITAHLWIMVGDFAAARRLIGLISSTNLTGTKAFAEKNLDRAQAKPAEPISYKGNPSDFYEWTRLLEGHGFKPEGELNDPVFLDISGSLKSLAPANNATANANNAWLYFDALYTIVSKVQHTQDDIDSMLKAQSEHQPTRSN